MDLATDLLDLKIWTEAALQGLGWLTYCPAPPHTPSSPRPNGLSVNLEPFFLLSAPSLRHQNLKRLPYISELLVNVHPPFLCLHDWLLLSHVLPGIHLVRSKPRLLNVKRYFLLRYHRESSMSVQLLILLITFSWVLKYVFISSDFISYS